MIKRIKIIVIFNLCVCALFAQKIQEVVFLKSGSIIRGTLLSNEAEIVKIETCCGNVFVFNQSDIEKIAPDTIDRSNRYRSEYPCNKVSEPLKEKGYLNFTSFGILLGSAANDKAAPFSFVMEHNYRVHKYFSLGITTGFEMLNESVMPLGLTVKGMLPLNRGNTLFLGATGGYSISLEKPELFDGYFKVKEASGGYLFNAELGVILPSSTNVSFFFAAGYRYNELNYIREDWWLTEVDRTIFFNRISLRLGMVFH